MKSASIIILPLFILTILSSCSKRYLTTQKNTAWKTHENNISSSEVTIGEWITYMTVTSFKDDSQPIYLADHNQLLVEKLPESILEKWNDYVFNAFGQKENVVFQKVYDHCSSKLFSIAVSAPAWDSIIRFKLLELPVIGISYDQAMGFIQYKEGILNTCHQKTKGSKTPIRYECFLPSPEKFDSAQTISIAVNRKGCPIYNYQNSYCADCPNAEKIKNHPVLKSVGHGLVYVWTYFPNAYGYYNFRGNVAEMTNVKGIAKGGSYFHDANEANIGHFQAYTKPEPWLGFRVWYKVYGELSDKKL